MVTFSNESKTCSCCGKSSTQQEIMSFTSFGGAPDLDLRPPPMQRGTITAWVQFCSHCGYCSNKIDDEHGTSRRTIVEQGNYQEQLKSNDYPALANHFLCYSIILENEGKFVEAAWQALRGAWACDDHNIVEAAKQCRLRAAQLIDQSRSANLQFSTQQGLDRCIQADALRRASEFQRAKDILHSMQGNEEDVIKSMCKFQIHLCDQSDAGCYKISDARQFGTENTN